MDYFKTTDYTNFTDFFKDNELHGLHGFLKTTNEDEFHEL